MPFSKELIELYEEIVNTKDVRERIELMMDLASQFICDVDDTDENVNEDVHGMVADFIEARSKFERRSLELARAIMRSVPVYLKEHPEEVPTSKVRPN